MASATPNIYMKMNIDLRQFVKTSSSQSNCYFDCTFRRMNHLLQVFHSAEISLRIDSVDTRLHRTVITYILLCGFIQVFTLMHFEIVQPVARLISEYQATLFAPDIVNYHTQLFRRRAYSFFAQRCAFRRRFLRHWRL